MPEVMYVVYSLHGGGAERLLTNILLSEEAPERNTVVVMRSGGTFRSTLENAGIEVTDLGMSRYGHVWRGALRLAKLIRERRPGIVHGWDYFSNLLAFAALKMARRGDRALPSSRVTGQLAHPTTRLFWAVFGTDYGPQRVKLRFRLTVRLNALLSSSVDGIIYNGAEVRDYHHEIGFRERRTVVISNSIDAEAFRRDLERREKLRQDLGIAPETVVVAAVARVDQMKDWPGMCAAVRDLPGVVTLAVGSGTTALPPQPGLIPLGWRDDIVTVLSAADIFLLGSAYGEGTSLAVGEAMLCGLPCIVTNVGGNATLVGDSGIIVEPRDVAAMRRAVIELARDEDRRRALGHLARARAMAATSRDEGVQRLHALTLAESST